MSGWPEDVHLWPYTAQHFLQRDNEQRSQYNTFYGLSASRKNDDSHVFGGLVDLLDG